MTPRFFFALMVLPTIITALMPPHPDSLNNPDDLAYHRLLHDASKEPTNQTSLLHPIMCGQLTQEQCNRADTAMVEQAASTRNLMKSTGTINTLVLLVRYKDHVDRTLPTPEDIHTLFNGGVSNNDIIPTGSVADWLEANSYNSLNINMKVMPWITTDNTEEHYSFGASGLHPKYVGAFEAVLKQLDDGTIDWSEYDLDNDGKIDQLIVLHSGYGAEDGFFDCYNGAGSEHRIWSHVGPWEEDPNPWRSKDKGITIGMYATSSALRGTCGSKIATIGTIAHEIIHTWGVPDLYDGDYREGIGQGTGVYDGMSNPYGREGGGLNPAFLSAWSKVQLNWLEPILLKKDGVYRLGASESHKDVYMIQEGFPSGEYLLIENRQPQRWDSQLWNGGVLVWHIDENAELQQRRGYPGKKDWPSSGDHYKVALLQADGKYDLEKGINTGDPGDFFVEGKELVAGPGAVIASNMDLYPNTDSYQYPNVKSTGIRLYDFSPSGEFMTFRVCGLSNSCLSIESSRHASTKQRRYGSAGLHQNTRRKRGRAQRMEKRKANNRRKRNRLRGTR